MIVLSCETADKNGFVVLKESPKSNKIRFSRRVNRVATLDGNSALSDQGFTHADNTINLKIDDISDEQKLILERLIMIYPEILYYENDAVFKGVISTLDTTKIPVKITFLVSEQVA